MTTTMNRLGLLTSTAWDVLVIGGGIYGATIADATARAGWRTALVEQNDYGAAASANSLKILHGGLRYMQQADLRRMRDSIRARSDGLRSFPHLTRPALFLAPTGKGLKRSALAYHIAARINDLVSFDRNRNMPHTHRLPRTRVLSKKEWARLLPDSNLAPRSALQWPDGFIENTERYTLEYILRAKAHEPELDLEGFPGEDAGQGREAG